MHTLPIAPLTAEAFAPFGTVVPAPETAGRHYHDDGLATLRPAARPSLSVALIEAAATLPLVCTKMERHPYSSQTFIPMAPARYLVLVAPQNVAGDGPAMDRAAAFVAEGLTGITYRANVWHHPMTVLSAPARFAITMWLDGTTGDEEFVDIDPLTITT
ncbi:ureidoglycolate lyase [Acuticoccus sp. M5D2P5]|uniref:ureidoglycolate lyase n=1 Tax=Acuticoccus kalidii TaxID=2910977 RepID=UPI001F1A2EE0|nr:ureidoglycolate lyase [Acuticoccus kalidii]